MSSLLQDGDGLTAAVLISPPEDDNRSHNHNPDRPQLACRQASPSESVILERNEARKKARQGDQDALESALHSPQRETVTARRVSTSPVSNPSSTLRGYNLTSFERNLRGSKYSGTFHSRQETINVPTYTEEQREGFVDRFTNEVNSRFNNGKRISKVQLEENCHMERVFKSLMVDGYVSDTVGIPGGMADISHCSRYRIENIVQQSPAVGSEETLPFILAIKSSIAKRPNSTLKKQVHKKQKAIAGTWKNGHERSFNNEKYTFFKCCLVPNDYHDKINNRDMTYNDFMAAYEDGGGFEVQFENVEGECGRMYFKWRNLVENPMDYLFFGPQLTSTMNMSFLFQDAYDVNYIHHIFVQLAHECWGDVCTSAGIPSSCSRF